MGRAPSAIVGIWVTLVRSLRASCSERSESNNINKYVLRRNRAKDESKWEERRIAETMAGKGSGIGIMNFVACSSEGNHNLTKTQKSDKYEDIMLALYSQEICLEGELWELVV